VLGLAILLVAVVRQIGPWKFASGAPLAVTIALGFVLTIGGSAWIVHDRRRIAGYLPGTLQGKLPDFAYDNPAKCRLPGGIVHDRGHPERRQSATSWG
jgi:hypothetical protein